MASSAGVLVFGPLLNGKITEHVGSLGAKGADACLACISKDMTH